VSRSADDKRARFLEAQQHLPGVPVTTTRPVREMGRASLDGALTVAAGRVVDFPLRELHLFAGAGGGILGGLLLGHTPVCAVEIDAYCRKVLAARQADGWLPEFPIYEDVRQFDGKPWRGLVDVVAGGFPCQPWSTAGKRKGTDDPRHLWPEMARIVEEVRPTYVFAENVSLAALEEPWRDLRGLGYRVPPALCVAASDVGAPHIRKRWWLLAADAESQHAGNQRSMANAQRAQRRAFDCTRDVEGWHGISQRAQGSGGAACRSKGNREHVADADSHELRAKQGRREPGRSRATISRHDGITGAVDDALRHGPWHWWQTEPPVGRVVDGLAHRVDRLRALGNGQVPMAAATAWHYLMEQL
jgi:DNA (cytosine-5)-methyltransferase 1